MDLSKQVAMVLVVFALLGGLVWLTKKRGMVSLGGRRGKMRYLEPLERIQLTPHHAIHLVRVSDRVVLIATAPSACTLLNAPISSDLPSQVQRDLLAPDR